MKKPSVIPLYAAGAISLLYAALFPMVRWMDFIIAALVCAAAYFVVRKIFPGKEIVLEVPLKTGDAEADKVLEEGFNALREMRSLNEAIEDPGISAQIGELESISGKIFEVLAKEPENIRKVRVFLDYYLPTTIKLLSSYKELSEQRTEGQTILTTMEKIRNILDRIVQAFKKEHDDLFLGKAIDITAEIGVLEGMIASEGISIGK